MVANLGRWAARLVGAAWGGAAQDAGQLRLLLQLLGPAFPPVSVSVIAAATASVTGKKGGRGSQAPRNNKQTQFPQINLSPQREGKWRGLAKADLLFTFSLETKEIIAGAVRSRLQMAPLLPPPFPPSYSCAARDDTGILNQTKWLLWCQPEIMNLRAGQHRGAEPGVHN